MVFLCLMPMAIIYGDPLGIGVCLFALVLMLGIVVYQLRKVYFILTDQRIEFGTGATVVGTDIARFEVYESRGTREGYYTCLNVRLDLKTPASDKVFQRLCGQKWVNLSEDRQSIVITLDEPSAHYEAVRSALARLTVCANQEVNPASQPKHGNDQRAGS